MPSRLTKKEYGFAVHVLYKFIKSLKSISYEWLNAICWSSRLSQIFIKKWCAEFSLTFFGTEK